MFYNAKSSSVKLMDADMEYISFGKGDKVMIMLPGLGDALRSMKGTAWYFALLYKKYTKDYTVYVFSRKNKIPEGYTTRDMARDQAEAMKELGITQAYVIGVSQGGMISQWLAIDYPELVSKLVLVVTLSRQNETIKTVLGNWLNMAKAADYRSIMLDTAEKSYSQKYIEKHRLSFPLLGKFGKPKDFTRFMIQGNACINHNTYEELEKINCPTLIIGGDCDKIVEGKSSRDIAGKIAGSQLYMYKELGHGLYDEAPDFNQRVLDFLNT